MRSLRRTIEISDGVNVDLLFTPHLFTFEGVQGASFERIHNDTDSEAQKYAVIFELYADIMFAAALNAWVLDGHGTIEDAPFKRGDFHAFMTADPTSFGKVLNFALEALTGKCVQQLVKDAAASKEAAKESTSDDKPEEGSKKKFFSAGLRGNRSVPDRRLRSNRTPSRDDDAARISAAA